MKWRFKNKEEQKLIFFPIKSLIFITFNFMHTTMLTSTVILMAKELLQPILFLTYFSTIDAIYQTAKESCG